MEKTALKLNRRVFMMHLAVGAGAVVLLKNARAQTAVAESDTQAQALGYKSDASKVDKTKQAKYAPGQLCSSCALYQGATGASSGPCPIFAGKVVSAKGWCSAWAKKV